MPEKTPRTVWRCHPVALATDMTEVERQIAGLANRSTPDLRVAWRQLHRTGPPLGLSRDLLIRALASQLQEQSYGGASRALRATAA